jgi:hypothetical protein
MRAAYPRCVAPGILLTAIVLAISGCGGSTSTRSNTTPASVELLFFQHGIALVTARAARIAGYAVTELEYDPKRLTTTTSTGDTVLTGQWLIVLVFNNASAATHALRDRREAQSIQAFGLTVVAKGNVVATILRGDATQDRLRRIRSALHQAIAG